ncbi:MAG: Hsp70 family protein, partial [Acidimicrobiia bacterium]
TGQSALSRDDIQRMMREAESHADEDRRRKEEAELRNQADTLVYQTEKLLREQGEKVSGEERTQMEDSLKELKGALAGTDVEAVRKAHEALVSASQGFAQRLYQQAASSTTGRGGGGTGPGRDDEVADAEIVDEEKGA